MTGEDRTTPRPWGSIECVMCGGTGHLVDVTEVVEAALAGGHRLAALPFVPPTFPPGPYRMAWPEQQGGLFSVWGHQGTPPDFADGWAIPLVASGTRPVMEWLVDLLNRSTP